MNTTIRNRAESKTKSKTESKISDRRKIQSALASAAVEGIYPSEETLEYIEKRLRGEIDCETHIAELKVKYTELAKQVREKSAEKKG